jgi:hypothetical protein
MGTTFIVNGREIKTRFGELTLCRYCKRRVFSDDSQDVCTSKEYPFWDEGWCKQFIEDNGYRVTYADARKMCAEAFQDGIESEREECGAERYRAEPQRPED